MARKNQTLITTATNLLVIQTVRWVGAIFFLLWCLSNTTKLLPQEISFDCLTLDQGLSQSTVTSIIQDETGYMWFGTIDGLNRFDGYNFEVFKNDPNDSNSVSDNIIMSLCKCDSGALWIGTLSGGLNKYDYKTGRFKKYPIQAALYDSPLRREFVTNIPFNFSFLNHNSIKALCKDKNGNLWIGTFSGGLYRFDTQNKSFIHYPYDNGDTTGLMHNIMSICETVKDKKSTLWLATYGGGLIKFEQDNGFRYYSTDDGLCENRIMAVFPDTLSGKQVLWLATYGGGLVKFEIEREKFYCYRPRSADQNSVSSNYLMSVRRDQFGDLWIGTFDAGLNRFDIRKNKFACFQHDPTNVNSIGSNEVLSLFEDQSGVIWIGTNFGYGINRFSRGKNLFKHYFHDPDNANSLSENVVFSIFEDRQGDVWVGTFQTGLNKFDRETETFINYRHDENDRYSISDNHIRSVYEDRFGRLWIGAFHGGLNYFNRDLNRFEHFLHNPQDPNSIGGNLVRSIYEDETGTLWIAVQSAGVERFDYATKKFTHFRHNPDDENSLCDDRAYYVTGDKKGSLWIATFGGGVSHYDLKLNQFTNYRHDPQNINSLCDQRIITISPDQNDNAIIWIGSFGSGFDKFNIQSQTFTHYTDMKGLPNNVVYAILPDDEGNLWISTNKGIGKFNPKNEIFINYNITDGLQSNEFNAGAYYKSQRTDEMFFGGVNGFNCFFPKNIMINNLVPNIVLTSLRIFDVELTDSIGPLVNGKQILLDPDVNFFSLEFSVLDFTNSRKNQYAFKLSCLENEWNYCGNRRFVNYTNLDPGEYVFHVKGANSDGVWNEKGSSIKLILKPHFYQTWWWHPTVVGVVILLVIIILTQRTRLKIKRSLELERIRVYESERVRKAIAADFHDELGQKLTRISLFSEIVRRKLSALSSVNIDYIEKINSIAKELAGSTRDFIWSLDPDRDSLYDMAIYLKDFGDEIFDKTDIDFRVDGISKNLEQIKLQIGWRRHLTLIFKEAMNNVIKHAQCQNVCFKIACNKNKYEISLFNDGIGNYKNPDLSADGIKKLESRAEKINCKLKIITNGKNGTTVLLQGEITQMGN